MQTIFGAAGEGEHRAGKPLRHAVHAMRDGCVMARVGRNDHVQRLDNSETKRFGYPLLETLQRTFNWMKKVESKATHHT